MSRRDNVVDIRSRAECERPSTQEVRGRRDLPYALFDFELWTAWQRASAVTGADDIASSPTRQAGRVVPLVVPPSR